MDLSRGLKLPCRACKAIAYTSERLPIMEYLVINASSFFSPVNIEELLKLILYETEIFQWRINDIFSISVSNKVCAEIVYWKMSKEAAKLELIGFCSQMTQFV